MLLPWTEPEPSLRLPHPISDKGRVFASCRKIDVLLPTKVWREDTDPEVPRRSPPQRPQLCRKSGLEPEFSRLFAQVRAGISLNRQPRQTRNPKPRPAARSESGLRV